AELAGPGCGRAGRGDLRGRGALQRAAAPVRRPHRRRAARHLSREPRGTPGVYASRWASPASWAIIPDSMKLKHFLAFLFCSLLPVAAWIVAREERPPATPSVALAARTPLLFEENVGQTADAVRFLARAPGYALFLTDEEAVLRP